MKPAVLLQGLMTGEMLENAWQEIETYKKLGETQVALVIKSEGGNGTKALQFIDRMHASGLKFSAKIYHAESAAALIALSASRREMVKNGLITIHLGSVEIESCDIGEDGTIPLGYRAAAERIRDRTFEVMARVGIPKQGSHVDMLLATNRLDLPAADCLKFRIVDRVIG